MKKAFTGINNLLDDMDANLAEELKYEPVIKREASIASDAGDETKVDDVAPSPVVEKRKRISPATSPPLSKRKRNEKRIVDEDDYLFATNSSGIENHLLIVREENNKEYAREYLYNKTKFYYCRSCKKNGKAIYAAAHDDLHGKFVVRVPLDDQHCDSCIPVEYEKLKSEAYSRIPHSGSKKKQNVAPTTMVNNVNFSWSQVIADQRNAGTNACSSKSTTPAPKFDERPQTLQGLIEAQTEETVDPIPDLFPPQPGVLENMLLPFPSVRLVPESQWDFSVDPTNHYYDGKLIVKDASDSIWGRQYTFASPSKNGTLIFKCCCCDVNPFNCNVYLVRDENEKISAFEFILVIASVAFCSYRFFTPNNVAQKRSAFFRNLDPCPGHGCPRISVFCRAVGVQLPVSKNYMTDGVGMFPDSKRKNLQINGIFILISLGTTSTVDGGGVLWFISVATFLVSTVAAVLFLLDKSDMIVDYTGGVVSWNLVEFIYSSIFSILCLLGFWLAFTYSGHVTESGQSTGYITAGLLLVLQTTFYTAPALMLYPKIRENEIKRYNTQNHYENDNDIPYQGQPINTNYGARVV